MYVHRYLLGVVLCMKVIIYEMRMRPRRNISCLLICSMPLWRVTSHIYLYRVVTYYSLQPPTTTSTAILGPGSRGRQPALMQGDEIILVSVTNCRDAAVECSAAVKCRAAVECVECSTVSACFELCCWQSICSSASWARSASDSRQRAPHLWPADHNLSFSKYSDWEWAW